jgi:cobalt/nickel transport system permease protein
LVDLGLDKYAHLESPIHHWDARYKLIGLMGLIFAFSFVQDLHLLPALLGITLILFTLSKLPFRFLMTRLRYPGVFLLAVAIVLPLFSGTTILFQLGPLAIHQEGLLDLLVIAVKFFCILTLGLVLFGSAPFLTTIKAMRALRLSPILADMMLLTYRYIFEIGYDLKKMEISMRLRNFRAGRFSFRGINTLASVSGTLLIRSYERSERIYKAMILRGYGDQASGSLAAQAIFQTQQRDVFILLAFLLLAGVIVSVELILR